MDQTQKIQFCQLCGLPHRTARTKSPKRSAVGMSACVPADPAAWEPPLLGIWIYWDQKTDRLEQLRPIGFSLAAIFTAR